MPEPIEVHHAVSAVDEVRDGCFGDARLSKRACKVVARIERAPGLSFPDMAASDAELEGMYRFFNHERVTADAVLAPHIARTVARVAELPQVLVVHDTSEFAFKGEREDLGYVSSQLSGFLGHVSLAVTADAYGIPLGTLAAELITKPEPSTETRSQKTERNRNTPREEKLSSRWDRAVVESDQALGEAASRAIHVTDQEGDDFAFFAPMVVAGKRFVIRGNAGRLLRGRNDGPTIGETLARHEGQLLREVPISSREKATSKKDFKSHPPREARLATLHVRAARIRLDRSRRAQTKVKEVEVNVVEVFEPNPPADEAPISWTLLTTEPIETLVQVTFIVDCYRARWRIEEFFKALKSGCAIEKRQLGSFHALGVAFALFAPVAWRLLMIRDWGRSIPNEPATLLFTPYELQVLRKVSQRVKLSEQPTIGEAMLAIAGLGGHLKRNGAPGWQTLGRGYIKFLQMLATIQLLQSCDQS